MKKINILVSCKNEEKILDNELLTSIQAGCEIAYEKNEQMVGDNTGENISSLYPYYEDLTVQYWVWKNYDKIGNPDFVGLMSDNKHFIFNENYYNIDEEPLNIDGRSTFVFDSFSEDYTQRVGLEEDIIKKAINEQDAVFCKKQNLNLLGYKNIKEEFIKNGSSSAFSDYNLCIGLVKQLYPQYESSIKMLNKFPYKYMSNAFILKKSLFFEYSEFLFNILAKFNETMEVFTYPNDYKNVCKRLGDILLTLFVLKLYKDNKNKIKELYLAEVKSLQHTIVNPYYTQEQHVIACASSNLYVPYFAVYLKSIIENSKATNKYDIVVLESDISDFNKKRLLEMVENLPNIALRFYNVNSLFDNINLSISYDYFAKQCYYRLALGKIFAKYKKVLFTDIDLIFNSDPNEYFTIDLKNNVIAASEEILWSRENRKGRIELGKNVCEYISKELNCSDKYYNTGVILVDIEKFNNTLAFKDLIDIAKENQYINQEQDVLNKVFNGKFLELENIYNFEIYNGIFEGKDSDYLKYMINIDTAKVYHYLTYKKAWFFPENIKADVWWSYARKTPFYEEILARMVEFKITNLNNKKNSDNLLLGLRKEFIDIHFPNINYHDKLVYVMQRIPYFELKKFIYKLKKAFSFGERHKKYQDKYNKIKKLIKDAKKLKKDYKRV